VAGAFATLIVVDPKETSPYESREEAATYAGAFQALASPDTHAKILIYPWAQLKRSEACPFSK
jgi:hypothetical protein